MSETPARPFRRHTLSPASSAKKPLSELIQQFEHPGSCNNQDSYTKDDWSVLSPVAMLCEDDKENTVNVSQIASKFKGNSTVKSRDEFFKSMVERRNEEAKAMGKFKGEPVGNIVKAMTSPIKVEFMKAWVEDVITNGAGGSPGIKQATNFLAEFGVKEKDVGQEEWSDWSEAMRLAHRHGQAWQSPVKPGPLSCVTMTPSKYAPVRYPELDSSIDAYSIKISPTKGVPPTKASNNDISFDIDDGERYTEHMMSQYPGPDEHPDIRSSSLESVALNDSIVCPVVQFSTGSRQSCDSAYTEGACSAVSQKDIDAKRAPKTCASWFGCF